MLHIKTKTGILYIKYVSFNLIIIPFHIFYIFNNKPQLMT